MRGGDVRRPLFSSQVKSDVTIMTNLGHCWKSRFFRQKSSLSLSDWRLACCAESQVFARQESLMTRMMTRSHTHRHHLLARLFPRRCFLFLSFPSCDKHCFSALECALTYRKPPRTGMLGSIPLPAVQESKSDMNETTSNS